MIAANPDFDLASCVQARLLHEDAALQPASVDLFSLSPLTSPEPTPPPSPQITPVPSLPNPASDGLDAEHFSSSTRALPLPIDHPPPPMKDLLTPSSKIKNRKAAKKAASHAQRSKRRAAAEFRNYVVRVKVANRYVNLTDSIRCGMDTQAAPVQSTGFTARDDGTRPQKEHCLDEMVGETSRFKFRLEKWDGR